MKFMKLGSKPDSFQSDHDSKSVRCVSSELVTDFIIIVDEVKFHLHKFPLLSKSNRLQKLALIASEENSDVHLVDFPGGPKIFEICAKFCYGMTVSISPYNVVAVRCAADYLEMTEDIDRGNLIYKIDVFLKSSILCSWKDSIIALQTTKDLREWSEDIEITAKCIEAIAMKTAIDPSCVNWSYTYDRKLDSINKVPDIGLIGSVPKDWWIEDLCELDIDVYKRVMFAVISKKRVEGDLIGEALKTYCLRRLPDCNDRFESNDAEKYKSLIESMICLLTPDHEGVNCSCSFLLKLLKVSVLVGVDPLLRHDLIRDISFKLDEASVRDLLIPADHTKATVYDVELVQDLVDRFFDRKNENDESNHKNDSESILIDPRRCKTIGRLIDGYLSEIARDRNLPPSVFTTLSRSIPDAARAGHDGIYGAVDVYLKEHPTLIKSEKKKICELIDVKKLSQNASIHAAQNDRLPLRTVVQILFHEHIRATAAIKEQQACTNQVDKQEWEIKLPLRSKSLRTPSRLKLHDGDAKAVANGGSMRLLPSRSRRILERFWVVGMSHRHGERESTVTTSGSSQSKSSSSSSRKHRYSIS